MSDLDSSRRGAGQAPRPPAPGRLRAGLSALLPGWPWRRHALRTTAGADASAVDAMVQRLPGGVLIHDAHGRVVQANPAALRLLDATLAQLQRRAPTAPHWRLVRGDDGAASPWALTRVGTDAPSHGLVDIALADGDRRWLQVDTEVLTDDAGHAVGALSCLTDITAHRREAADAAARAGAPTDALTALPGRGVVLERLARALVRARAHPRGGFAVLCLGVDRFKQVNDTLGHGAGDELLRQVAERLRRALRPGDALAVAADGVTGERDGADAAASAHAPALAARLDGDEFVVVLERSDDAAAAPVVAQRLLERLGEPYAVRGAPVHGSVSIGVVHVDPARLAAGASADDVLCHAGIAMVEAKRGGRARWVAFEPSMHDRVVDALALQRDLRQALADGALSVVYQPLIDLATRRLTGVEALVRWHHPTRGTVPPLVFIPVAEDGGLIAEVGQTVLRLACRQFVQWRRELGEAAPAQLAVNVSRAQLIGSELVDGVRALLAEFDLPPQRLQLEITESLAAQDERVQATLRELKNLGVKLALDDFGTGYSSLACLHLLPVDTVKIDRSFVAHAEAVEYHRVLIEATIRVARTLGMTTVAEGIETEAQAALMRALDCDRGQGYLYSRPIDGDALAAYVRRAEASRS